MTRPVVGFAGAAFHEPEARGRVRVGAGLGQARDRGDRSDVDLALVDGEFSRDVLKRDRAMRLREEAARIDPEPGPARRAPARRAGSGRPTVRAQGDGSAGGSSRTSKVEIRSLLPVAPMAAPAVLAVTVALAVMAPLPRSRGVAGAGVEGAAGARPARTDCREVIERASRAIEAGTFDRRPDRHVITLKMNVDEQGWSDIASTVAEGYERLALVEAESANRTPDPEQRFRVTVSLLSYESPQGEVSATV